MLHGQACAAPQVIAPEQFGAVGDGRADDTAAIQRALDAAPRGAAVRLRPGAVYMIDTNFKPTMLRFGGLKMRSGRILELNGAELRALPSADIQGAVVQGFGEHGWHVRGPGKITGERSRHRGTAGEWGMGVAAFTASGWRIDGDVEVSDCWGDGIYVGGSSPGTFCQDFVIESVRVSRCRRNGISVVAGRNGRIRNVAIRDISGTAPQGAIDLEPDHTAHPNRNISIEGLVVRGEAQVGIYVTVANENIVVNDVDMEADNSGILIAGEVRGLRIANSRIRSRRGGAEGAAIRSSGSPALIRGVDVRNNVLSGGGYFVVDFFGDGFRGLAVVGNEIRASNSGTQGIARVHHGIFTDNRCVIERVAGKGSDYFVHLQGTTHGRNAYRNLSRHRMHAAFRGGRRMGGDSYDPTLTWAYEDI